MDLIELLNYLGVEEQTLITHHGSYFKVVADGAIYIYDLAGKPSTQKAYDFEYHKKEAIATHIIFYDLAGKELLRIPRN